jgi:hypothetical protein
MRSSRIFLFALTLLLGIQVATAAESNDSQASENQSSAYKAIVDQVFYNEAKLYQNMKQYRPLVETYIQNYKPDSEQGRVPSSDKYFLGRLILDKGITQADYGRKHGFFSRVLDRLDNFYKMNYMPTGFMQLLFLDVDFDRQHYDLNFRHREFLGQVRCMVFDAVPHKKVKGPHFVGRIWVEDQSNNIVRINGTYLPEARTNYYFHFDSWRLNVQPDVWLPAFVYTEESDAKYAMFRKLMMRGQTRLWDYDQSRYAKQGALTSVTVDPAEGVVDRSDATDNAINPIESKHQWEREAEDNVLERMERSGLLAPQGEVSKVLETVVNNLVVTNKLNIQPEVRCRVLLTTPLESFTVGHTIVVSRGLLDVLPDESSLAAVLAHELGHIVLGHSLDTKYAFSDRMTFPDEETFRRIGLRQDEREEVAADQKGIELLNNSPYKDKLQNVGLFLRQLQNDSHSLPALISPHFGNKFEGKDYVRMQALIQSAPELQPNNLNQVSALPLGSRIKLDPWSDQLQLQKDKPVLYSARDKMPFEVTPMVADLARFRRNETVASTAPQASPPAQSK